MHYLFLRRGIMDSDRLSIRLSNEATNEVQVHRHQLWLNSDYQ